MKAVVRFSFLFSCTALVLGLTLSACRTSPDRGGSKGLEIGASEIDITPPLGYRLAGYFSERLATGTHDPLKAKALVFKEGNRQIAMVFCDLVGLSLHVTTNARAHASQLTGIPVSNIMMCATHSHTGPLFDNVIGDQLHKAAMARDGKDPAESINYPEFLAERLARVVADAQKKLAPGELDAGIAQQENLNFNRRYWMKNGKVAFNPGIMNSNIVKPAGPIDKDVGILLARDKSGQPFAGITVFAMHCDTIGGTEYSADYPYFLQQTLRRKFGPEFISAFGAGTCGDINNINVHSQEPFKGFEASEKLGNTLGNTVAAAVPQLEPIKKPALAVRSAIVPAGLQDVTPEELADARSKTNKLADPDTDFFVKVVAVKRLDIATKPSPYPLEVQVFRLADDTAVVCLPSKFSSSLGSPSKMRRRSQKPL